jgi:hypothetical protein
MDQIVVHLSTNHATLPRLQIFLSQLQIGPMSIQAPVLKGDASTSRFWHNVATHTNQLPQEGTSQLSRKQPNRTGIGQVLHNACNAVCNSLTLPLKRAHSISEEPLQCQQDIELRPTTVCVRERACAQKTSQNNLSPAASLPSDSSNGEDGTNAIEGVRVTHEFSVSYNNT